MSAVLLALASALAYGSSDFLGGLLSRRVNFAQVGLVMQVGAVAASCCLLPIVDGAGPTAAALGWGALSGLGGGVGSLVLYRGLGRGQMSVVSPLAALASAVLPAVVGIISGERPSALALAGIVLALPALWLTARPPGQGRAPTAGGVRDGLVSGAGFALLFIALAHAGGHSGLWPLVASAVVSLLLQAGFVLLRHPVHARDVRRTRPQLAAALLTGVVSAAATLLYFLAAHAGLLTVVAVLSSLYPAVTVLLAVLILREHPSRAQQVGLMAAAAAVALVST